MADYVPLDIEELCIAMEILESKCKELTTMDENIFAEMIEEKEETKAVINRISRSLENKVSESTKYGFTDH